MVARAEVAGKDLDEVVNYKVVGPKSWKVWIKTVFVSDVQRFRDPRTLNLAFLDG